LVFFFQRHRQYFDGGNQCFNLFHGGHDDNI
jgi:hypothetical protein